jgi:hypothetical protein
VPGEPARRRVLEAARSPFARTPASSCERARAGR